MEKYTISNPSARLFDNAIVIDVSSVGEKFRGRHLTLFYRAFPKFTKADIDLVNKAIDADSMHEFVFTLMKWGQRSDLMCGDFEHFCSKMQALFPQYLNGRPLHIEMR